MLSPTPLHVLAVPDVVTEGNGLTVTVTAVDPPGQLLPETGVTL